jgi:hypothetical protein
MSHSTDRATGAVEKVGGVIEENALEGDVRQEVNQ